MLCYYRAGATYGIEGTHDIDQGELTPSCIYTAYDCMQVHQLLPTKLSK